MIKGAHRYRGMVRPGRRCEIGGLLEDSLDYFFGPPPRSLGREGSFAVIPIKGEVSESGNQRPIYWD